MNVNDLMADYVIIGGGSAGCVLAARLSEDQDVTVILLEAGGEDTNPLIHIPAAHSHHGKPRDQLDVRNRA